MADISAKAVMDLRKKLGASMMECKKALVEANGDEAAAIKILKEKGAAKAEKKSDRETGEGTAVFSGNAYVKLLCETDFVGRNEDFVAFAQSLADKVLAEGVDATKAHFEEVKADKVAQFGENLVLEELGTVEGDVIAGYVHSNGKIAAVVGLSGGDEAVARDVAMHIVGMNPSVISYKDIDAALADKETAGRIAQVEELNIERERLGKHLLNVPKFISQSQITDEILADIEKEITAELLAEGKPEKIIPNILPGKIKRFIADNTSFDKEQALLSQDFVKDTSKTIEDVVSDAGASVVAFVRLAV
jgi:elongation factor Ts